MKTYVTERPKRKWGPGDPDYQPTPRMKNYAVEGSFPVSEDDTGLPRKKRGTDRRPRKKRPTLDGGPKFTPAEKQRRYRANRKAKDLGARVTPTEAAVRDMVKSAMREAGVQGSFGENFCKQLEGADLPQ